MNPDTEAKPNPKTTTTGSNDSNENALSPKELDKVAGGRASNDPCEGGQIR
jgi:hypothetical protein